MLAYTGIKIVQELSITSTCTIIIIMVLQYTFVVYFVNCYILVCNFVVTDISVLKSILVFKLKDTHVIGNLGFYISNLSLHIYHDTPFSLLTPHEIFRQLDSNHTCRLNVTLKYLRTAHEN